jgi:hypothetical protein
MRHERCPRFLAALAAAILIALCLPEAYGQTRCSVDQEFFFGTVTGRFTVGTVGASLTLPRYINEAYLPLVLLVEFSAPHPEQPEEKLMIRSGHETVDLRDGAALHVARRKGERLTFSVATSYGKELCSWQPPVAFLKKEYANAAIRNSLGEPRRPATIIPGHGDIFMMHITGEPIGLIFRHTFSEGQREFRLGGVPARVLMETPVQFFLRDPHPSAGVRKLESEGETVAVHFIDVEKRLIPTSGNRENLNITVTGWRPEAGAKWPSFLSIINLNPQEAKLDCGIWHNRREQGEVVMLLISPSLVHDGSFAMSCEVRSVHPKPASVGDFGLNFTDFVARRGLLGLWPF